MKLKVKICGITNPADAVLAEKYGADLIGMVFSRSPRKINTAAAKKIISVLSPFTMKAGVFVNESPVKVIAAAERARLDVIQLHGEEEPEYIRTIKNSGLNVKIIKAVRVKDRQAAAGALEKYRTTADAFLFDAYDPVLKGGTGKTFDPGFVKGPAAYGFVAGGITPENVCGIIKETDPMGIDVSSGVEKEKGKKSEVKIKRLFEKIRTCGK
ncbi:MAG: phosphoribosylanthranilate isomerase [Candidatus Goldiibacteriota bacterium]